MVNVAKWPVIWVRDCGQCLCWRLVIVIGRTGDVIDGYFPAAEAVLVVVILADNDGKNRYIAVDDPDETTVAVMWKVK